MASYNFNQGVYKLADRTIDYVSDTIKARLVKSTSAHTKDDTDMSGVTKITGTTDQTLGSKAIAVDMTNDRVTFTGAVITWSAVAAGETVMGVVIFKFVTNDAGSTPIAFIDTTDLATNGSDFTLTADATNKFFYLQQ
jgi:hypothetical protein